MAHNQYLLNNQIECSTEQLNRLKEHFRGVIDSRRSLGRIHSLKELLLILNKRDCNSDYIWYYINEINPNIHYSPPHIDNLQSVFPPVADDPVKQIDELIVSEIGHKWINLARELKIPEGRIDELGRMPRSADRVRDILQNHRRNPQTLFWKNELFNALDKARRKDLRIKIQNILAKHDL